MYCLCTPRSKTSVVLSSLSEVLGEKSVMNTAQLGERRTSLIIRGFYLFCTSLRVSFADEAIQV